MQPQLIWRGFLHAAGVVAYITIIAWTIFNGEKFFGVIDQQWWGPVLFLLLFVVSALITSLLVLGKPILLYAEGKRREGIILLFATASWLIICTIILFLTVAILSQL